jgi:predicted MFS family arabinose efflux permease
LIQKSGANVAVPAVKRKKNLVSRASFAMVGSRAIGEKVRIQEESHGQAPSFALRNAQAKGGSEETHETKWVLPATILGSSLGFIDSSVVNVALPAIQSGLGAQLAAIQWVMNGYKLTLASLILLGGAVGDRLGLRRVFLIGLVGFAVTSIACGMAPSAAWLVAGRLAQGAAAALLVPASLAIIGAAYTGEARAQAIGTWAAAGALTTALGPVFGGWLVDTIG